MSVDPRKLEVGDRVKFGGVIIKEIAFRGTDSIWFSSGGPLNKNDSLWEIAELERPPLPHSLRIAKLTEYNFYKLVENDTSYTPEYLLRLLKLDVTRLEAAGVKET